MLRESIRIDPNYAQAHRSLAETLAGMGRDEEAAFEAMKATRLTPLTEETKQVIDVAQAMLAAGRLYQAEQYDEALAQFAALKTQAEEAGDEGLLIRLENNIGLCKLKLGELEEAERIFTAIVAADSTYVKALNNLGLVREEMGDPEGAVAYYRRTLAIKATDMHARRAIMRLTGERP
jgi:Tfp pilus assembly protein PilF